MPWRSGTRSTDERNEAALEPSNDGRVESPGLKLADSADAGVWLAVGIAAVALVLSAIALVAALS